MPSRAQTTASPSPAPEVRNSPESIAPASPPFAQVAVNATQPARTAFTYSVPLGMAIGVGQAVFVPFGPRILQGVVLSFAAETDIPEVRPIAAVADPEPVLDEAHVALARWLSESYLAPLWECVSVCLPTGYGQRSVTMVSPVDIPPLLPIYPKDQKILRFVAAHGQVTLDALREGVGAVSMSTLERLQRDGHLTVAQGLARPAGHARLERRVALAASSTEAEGHAAALEGKAPRSVDARLLRVLAAKRDLALSEVRALGAGPVHVRRLEAAGLLRLYEAQVERDPLAGMTFEERPPLVLTADQQTAADAIAASPGETFLLHGITGSGKTEVYLDLVRRVLEAGKSAIVLVPEIALTPQAIRRYGERFGRILTVLHSGLGVGESYDQWHRIRDGEARLVIGSRSALFAPARDLGLVILDEEHETSYKQADPQPRYHAREAAAELSRLTGATLVLGTATPDVVTYYRSEVGQIRRIDLAERVMPSDGGSTLPGTLPLITVVDMRDELRSGNRSVFSYALARAIRTALAAGEQSILFVNRRGSARFMLCRECGYTPACSACEVAFSLNLRDPLDPRVVCHHCGRSKRLDTRCPRCNSVKYRPFGVGTQRIEQEARVHFKGARVQRWDSEVASRKGAHERILHALEAGEIDILVGTQMLAKGLDLPAMTVVGVVDADVGLSLPDYHAHERTFQLLSQVAGRAGRRDLPGWVYIQTYEPEAAPIQCAAHHDYRAFYEHELAHRRRAGYPPFARLVRLVYHHTNREHGLMEASRVASDLRLQRDAAGRAEPDVLGPTPAFIARVRGQYRWQILLRGRNPAALVAQVRLGDHWSVDVDPMGLM